MKPTFIIDLPALISSLTVSVEQVLNISGIQSEPEFVAEFNYKVIRSHIVYIEQIAVILVPQRVRS